MKVVCTGNLSRMHLPLLLPVSLSCGARRGFRRHIDYVMGIFIAVVEGFALPNRQGKTHNQRVERHSFYNKAYCSVGSLHKVCLNYALCFPAPVRYPDSI